MTDNRRGEPLPVRIFDRMLFSAAMRLRSALLAALLASIPASGGAEQDRRTRLDRGDVIVELHPIAGADLPEVFVTAVIDAPPDHVWQIIDHCADYQRTMVRIKFSRELSRVGNVVRCESIVSLPWPLPDLHGITHAEHTVTPDLYKREWRIESGDYKENSGSWTLTPWAPNRTLVEYRQHSQPKVRIPVAIQDLAARYALPDLIAKLRSEVK
jgi:hypothetical protein